MAAATFESLNPSTGEVIEQFPRSSAADVDRAVQTAKAAWEDWRLVPAPERGNILFRFAQLLEGEKPSLSDLMTREMGKVKAEAGGDIQEAIDMSYYMGGEGRRLFGQTTPSELRDKFMMSVRMPVGVVGAITPWNFPIAIPAWKLTPALVCGNTVVLKPAEDTPLLAQRFVDLLHEAGLPEGVVQIVHGFGEEAGDALVRHPDVPVITFTGSRAEKIDRRFFGKVGSGAIKFGDATDTLNIGEGIESTLSGAVMGYAPAWALGSAGAIARFPVIDGITTLRIFGERGDNNANSNAIKQLTRRWKHSGADIYTINPKTGNDLNDARRSERRPP